ncbi:hypothetical protein MCAMS1_01192 [biofilm metagenome]
MTTEIRLINPHKDSSLDVKEPDSRKKHAMTYEEFAVLESFNTFPEKAIEAMRMVLVENRAYSETSEATNYFKGHISRFIKKLFDTKPRLLRFKQNIAKLQFGNNDAPKDWVFMCAYLPEDLANDLSKRVVSRSRDS